MKRKPRICLLASNDLITDPRLTKQAETGVKFGFNVLLLGFINWDPHNKIILDESKDGYQIHRHRYASRWRRSFLAIELFSKIRKYFANKQETKEEADANHLHLLRINWQLFVYNWAMTRNQFFHHWRLKLESHPFFYKLWPHPKKIISHPDLIAPVSLKDARIANPPIAPPKKFQFALLQHLNPFWWLKYLLHKLVNYYSQWYHYYDFYNQLIHYLVGEGTKFKPDIIHANDLDTLLAGYLIKKKTGARLVYDAHEIWTDQGMHFPRLINWCFTMIEKLIIRQVDYFITVNESIAQELEKRYHYRAKVPQAIIYNCPKYEKIQLRRKSSPKIIILYQGGYAFNRGLEELIQAVRYLSPEIELHFRGTRNPPIQQALILMAKKNHLEKKVKFLKPVAMDKMVQAAKAADIGVVAYVPTNINNRLCSPNKLFEYMMAGLALAVSDLPELRKIIKKYNNGILFNPRNPHEIARKLNHLIKNPTKLYQMKKNSLIAAQEFNWEHEEKKLTRIYETLYDQK